MTIYIIILHFKNKIDTLNCSKSISKLDKHSLNIKVIIISNPSTSGESLIKSSKFKVQSSKLTIISNNKNLGFAAGVNVGIREALKDKNCSHILILNNDTILSSNLLISLLKEKTDIVSPVIKFKSLNNQWVYDFGGKINWWTGRAEHIESPDSPSRSHFVTPGRRPRFNRGLLPGGFEDVDYVSGCCMLVRREVFEKIGLFDEDYFFYFEDVDFCARAMKAGFKIAVNPKVAVYHKLGGSIGRWTNRAIFYNLISNAKFITKHLGWKKTIGYCYLLLLTSKILFGRLLSFLHRGVLSQS